MGMFCFSDWISRIGRLSIRHSFSGVGPGNESPSATNVVVVVVSHKAFSFHNRSCRTSQTNY